MNNQDALIRCFEYRCELAARAAEGDKDAALTLSFIQTDEGVTAALRASTLEELIEALREYRGMK